MAVSPTRRPFRSDDPGEGGVELAVIEVFPGDSEGRLGLPEAGLGLDPLDFGQAVGIVELPQACAGIAGLPERSLGGFEGLACRRRIEFCDQVTATDPVTLFGRHPEDGPGSRETEGRSLRLLDDTDIASGIDVGPRFDDKGSDAQGSGRCGRGSGRGTTASQQECGGKKHTFHIDSNFRLFSDANIPFSASTEKASASDEFAERFDFVLFDKKITINIYFCEKIE